MALKMENGVKRIKLENGMSLIFKRLRGESTIYAALMVDCGILYEDKNNNGISHFLEHLIGEEGKTKVMRERLLYKIEKTGAEMSAYTFYQFTEFHLDSSLEKWAINLRLFLDLIAELKFSEKDFLREQKVIIREIEDGRTESEDLYNFNLEAKKRAFPGHPLALPILGNKSNVLAITPQKIRAWHKCFYQPQRMTLIVAGDLSASRIIRVVKRSKIYFLANRKTLLFLPPKIEPDWTAGCELEKFNENITKIFFAIPDVGNALDNLLFYFIMYILDDTSTLSVSWQIERKLGIYDGIYIDDYRTACSSFLEVDLRAPSHKLLKKLENRFFAWITRVCRKGLSKDGFIRIRNRRIQDLNEWKSHEGNWWREKYIDAVSYHRLEYSDLFEDMSLFKKEEIERVFRKYLSERRLVFRSLKRRSE